MRHLMAGAAAVLLRLTLLLAAITLPVLAYIHSPRWLLQDAGPQPPAFFVAVRKPGAGPVGVVVTRYEPAHAPAPSQEYHLENRRYVLAATSGVEATVEVQPDRVEGQLVRIFVTGDTPWTALSEYRVVQNEVHPLRHAHSSPWLLLGVPLLVWLSRKVDSRVARALADWAARKPS